MGSSVCHMCACVLRGRPSDKLGYMWLWTAWHGCQETNSGPLEEQHWVNYCLPLGWPVIVFLTALGIPEDAGKACLSEPVRVFPERMNWAGRDQPECQWHCSFTWELDRIKHWCPLPVLTGPHLWAALAVALPTISGMLWSWETDSSSSTRVIATEGADILLLLLT